MPEKRVRFSAEGRMAKAEATNAAAWRIIDAESDARKNKTTRLRKARVAETVLIGGDQVPIERPCRAKKSKGGTRERYAPARQRGGHYR
jgi:hypothetical protein